MRAADGEEPSTSDPAGAEVLHRRLTRARKAGFTTTAAHPAAFVAKPRSHDDGPAHGMILGPIGGPSFSRDLTGRFNRWHLHPDTHLVGSGAPPCRISLGTGR